MASVKKANRIILVDESQVDSYLKRGYDQVNTKGEIVRQATGGKNVSVAEYNKVLGKVEEMKEEIKVLENENERLDKLVKQLKSQQHPKR